ncbi:hypothetical protein ACTFIY_006749 [Dictyostelium cf. discoideum]
MTEKHRVNFFYILFLFYILNYNFNVVISIFPTSFSQINSTNGFLISEERNQISITHGDLNGDGNDDLIYSIGSVGLYVFYGPLASNFDFQTDVSKINGSNGFIFLNTAVRKYEVVVGDINNDGFDDIAFFLYISPGKLCVIYGTDQIISPSTFSTVNGNNGFYISHVAPTNVGFGFARSIIDFNGDSIKDIFVSTSIGTFASPGTPVSYMIFGINGGKFQVNSQFEFDPSTLNGSNGFLINNFNLYYVYPYDMNNDGFGDIMVNRGQVAIDIIYGSRGPFTSPYIPVYDGVKGTSFSLLGCSINSNEFINAFGDFNNDGLNDFGIPTRTTNGYIAFLVWGKTEYPPTTILSINLNPLDGLVIADANPDSWAVSPRLGDINNDGFADFLISGTTNFPFTILFGNNKKYASNPIYLKDQVGDCSIMPISGRAVAIDIGDYNSDGIHDITASIINADSKLNIYTLYGQTSIGSISIVSKLFQPNPMSNSIYKLFENNINSEFGRCAIRIVTLTIENPANEDQFIIDPTFNSSIYSITFNNNTRVRIELILFVDESKSIANDVLPKITVSLSPQLFNRTILMKYGNQVQSIKFIGQPNANCDTKCLNGGTCNPFTGCQCINEYYGDYCELKHCTVPQCLNGGSCNTTVGECSCINGFYGDYCGTKDCTVPQCLNGGSCNTTIGECSCTQGYEGIDCSGISCSVSCLNGSCNTTVGECSCINDFYGDNCGTKDCTVPQCLNGGSCNTTVGECSCPQGYEGMDCSGISCSASCLNGSCNTTVGQCQCAGDYDGDNCSSENKKKTNIGVIIGPILGGLALIAIIVVAIVLIKKKKNGNSKKNTNNIELRPQGSTIDIQIGEERNQISITHGDLNGDGNDDLIYSVYLVGIYVFYGPLASNFGFQTDVSKINGSNGFIFLNTAVRKYEVVVGDINNDGFDDIALFLFISPGKLCVIYGTDQIISPSTFSTVNGNNGFYISHVAPTNVGFGLIRSIIDFNGDSIKDLFVSTSVGAFASSGTPISYMIFGINGGKFQVNSQFEFGPSTLNGSNGFLINNFNLYYVYPYDMNNDGFGDIMVNRGQVAIDIIYGSRGPFTSPYIPVYDGVKGTSFSLLGCAIDSNVFSNAFGDFNNDGLNDFGILTRLPSNSYIAFLVWGKTEYPPTTILSININPLDVVPPTSHSPFCLGNNKKYGSNPIYLKDQVGDCSIMPISGRAVAIDIGDYNSDGIHDIVTSIVNADSKLNIYTLYGQTSIGSISIVSKLFQPNSISNSIYKLFENNINSEVGRCAIRIVTLTIENPANEDQFIIDPTFNSSIYSITFNNNTRVRIELILFGDESKSIANEVLPKITVSLSPQLFNRTILMKYGNQVQSIKFIGQPNANCDTKCLNGGTCNPLTGCQCINEYYGDYCELKHCTIPQCLNGGSCNTTVGECSCAQGYEGMDCSGISCSASCLKIQITLN